jgi:[protein-PII] uridylyltransferase
MRAVGPAVWTAWKGQLLRDLFRLTEATLHGGRSSEGAVSRHLADLALQTKQRLVAALGAGLPEGWLDALEDGYWLTSDDSSFEWHARELAEAQAEGAAIWVSARVVEAQGKTDVLVFAPDRRGLFASLSSSLALAGADIVSARVYTTRAGAAFDVFSIQSQDRRAFGVDNPAALKRLISGVEHAAREDVSPPPLAPVARRASAFAIEPWVRVENDVSANATILEASGRDRRGLLAALAGVCAEVGVSVVSAHINTYGERAADVFYVQDERGGRVAAPRRIALLRRKLDDVLREAEPSGPTDPRKSPLAVGRASTAR